LKKTAFNFFMKIISTAFEHNGNIPKKFTCEGEGVNPPLNFSEVPNNAASLALIMDDPDAPIGTFDHWVVWNIPPKTTSILEARAPVGKQGKNGRGKIGYVPPCPPSGIHRYFFKLIALDSLLDSTKVSDKQSLIEAMSGHIIETVELVGLYQKTNK
jgi:Raf kinase inhibitor-like YbhB/YbcL family protein